MIRGSFSNKQTNGRNLFSVSLIPLWADSGTGVRLKNKIVHKGIFFYFFLSLLLWMYSVNFTCLRLLPHLMREKVWSAESYSWGLQGPNFLGRRDLKQIDGCRPSHSSPSAILFFMSLCPWHCPFYDFIVCIPNL